VSKVVMYASVSVDGFIADQHDQPGPLFDWLLRGDVPLDESGELTVSQPFNDYTRAHWDQIGATIAGRHVLDMTDGAGSDPATGRPPRSSNVAPGLRHRDLTSGSLDAAARIRRADCHREDSMDGSRPVPGPADGLRPGSGLPRCRGHPGFLDPGRHRDRPALGRTVRVTVHSSDRPRHEGGRR